MKIMTLNTWNEEGPWRQRWEAIFKGIEIAKPDIIGFQEIFDVAWANEVTKMSGLNYSVFPNDSSGLMVLTRFPIQTWNASMLDTQSPREDYRRYVAFVQVAVDGEKLAIFNTHLSWRLDEGFVRERQVSEILEIIKNKAYGLRAIVMGDFNATPDSQEIQLMKLQGDFVDTYGRLHPKEHGFSWDNRNLFTASHGLPDRRLDYIFVKDDSGLSEKLLSADLTFTQPDQQGVYASDHYGVITVLKNWISAKE